LKRKFSHYCDVYTVQVNGYSNKKLNFSSREWIGFLWFDQKRVETSMQEAGGVILMKDYKGTWTKKTLCAWINHL